MQDKKKESSEERKCKLEKYREYARTHRKNQSSEQREKRLAKNRSYKKSEELIVLAEIKIV